MTQSKPGEEVVVEEVFEDLGTFDPHSADGDDDPSVFEDDTDIDGLPEVDPDEEDEILLDELDIDIPVREEGEPRG